MILMMCSLGITPWMPAVRITPATLRCTCAPAPRSVSRLTTTTASLPPLIPDCSLSVSVGA
eukprot:15036464-Alexandrium_andersonii.AAC.1